MCTIVQQQHGSTAEKKGKKVDKGGFALLVQNRARYR